MEENVIKTAEDLNEALQEKKEAASYVDFKMVTFSLADKDYAIDIMYVKEIAKAGRFTYVPNTLPFVLGVYNLRGEIIPILDLRLFFNIEVQKRDDKKLENLLILTLDDQTFGLVVDKIDKVVGVQKSSIQPPHPLFADINIKYISGVVENNNRLYVLLDILRIFGSKDNGEAKEAAAEQMAKNAAMPAGDQMNRAKPDARLAPAAQSAAKSAPSAPAKKEEPANLDIKFIAESLKSYKNFEMSQINEEWVKRRYTEWASDRGASKTQLQSADDADAYLSNFYSSFTGTWWSKDYADIIKGLLPDNNAKQIVVWNPGCGSGIETYCLACVLKSRYPDAKIRIYAQDVDLLGVSNASLLSVPANLEGTWLSPYLSKKANGENTFNQEIKDSIMFEYHDCKNTNVLPMLDVIFARDFLSFIDTKSQENILSEFFEKMKGNAIAIVGENETIPMAYGFGETSKGAVTAYTKD
ncbi:MAG: chemotaxis protein CheW [Treponema sp.]|nr:chemotaxis protein CheW [Treponema sp.]